MGGNYTSIGSGGPCGDGRKYSINPGVPDQSWCDGVYLEGHVFEFKGQLILDKYTFWFKDHARIMVQNFTDVKCERDRQNPTTCEVAGAAYLVDKGGEGGDLFYVEDVKIRPDNDQSVPAWNYLGEGYITKDASEDVTVGLNQTITGFMDTSARLNSSITNLSKNATDLNDSIVNLVQEAGSLSADLKASGNLSDETKGKADDLVERLGGLSNISAGLGPDLDKAESELANLTRGIEDLKIAREALSAYMGDLSKGSTNLAGDVNGTTPACRYVLRWSGPDIICV